MVAIINTLNKAYDIEESRPWWKVRLTAIGLTIGLALFILVSFVLVVLGPTLAEKVARVVPPRSGVRLAWWVLQWPVVFALVATAIGLVYYFAPDAEQDFVWLTPGSVLATLLWLLFSLGFKIYVTNFSDYNETYGAIGGVIVLLLWFYTERSGHPDRRRDERRDRARLTLREGSWREGGGREEEDRVGGVAPLARAQEEGRTGRPAARAAPAGRAAPQPGARPAPARWCSAASSPAPWSSSAGGGGSRD